MVPISIRKNKLRSLGLEWKVSKGVTPPPHNLDKPHSMVVSINNNNNNNEWL